MRTNGYLRVVLGCLALLSASSQALNINQIQRVDFHLNAQREPEIHIALNSANVILDAKQTASGLILRLPDVGVMETQIQRLDVSEFASIIDWIDIDRAGNGAQLTLAIQGRFAYHYTVDNQVLRLTVKPLAANNAQVSPPSRDAISMNFQDIDVRRALQILAEYRNFNLVVADSVAGQLTLRLNAVPWSQALDLILQSKGLGKQLNGNVLWVAPVSELDLQRDEALLTQLVMVNYAKVADIAQMLTASSQSPMLSPRGSFMVDERTNAILLRDIASQVQAVSEVIHTLDVPVKQVQIEARIVSLNQGNLEELGVRWGMMSRSGQDVIGSSIEGNYGVTATNSGDSGDLNLDNLLNVNLAATSANTSSIAFQIATLGRNTLLDLELSALQSESKAEIISSPSLLTTNKQPAYIEQGTEIPYVEAASSGATSVAFKKAVLSLKVTPQITPDNRLVLDLSVTQDRPGEVVKTGTGEAVAIQTQRIGTQVLVDSGETVVLGGIYQHSLSDTVDKVPVLGDLPLVGALFRRSYQKMGKSELLIFVTPKVVTE